MLQSRAAPLPGVACSRSRAEAEAERERDDAGMREVRHRASFVACLSTLESARFGACPGSPKGAAEPSVALAGAVEAMEEPHMSQ